MRKTFKKITCGVLALACTFGSATNLVACKTSDPEVKMTIEFNGETYTLNYKLDRNVAPQTVEHFLWLADNEFYDGLCVHDYSQDDYTRMYTGAYQAAEDTEDADGLVYKKYYDTIKESKDFDDFPVSVWMQKDKENPTYTLKGEFSENKYDVKNGELLKETFGSLTMYYHSIPEEEQDIADKDVYMISASGDELIKRDYKYNYTTSMFYISLSNTAVRNKMYCTFATLKSGSVDELEDLKEALDEYIEEKFDDDVAEFAPEKVVTVCTDDPYLSLQNVKEKFNVPKTPIIIKKVKVTKW